MPGHFPYGSGSPVNDDILELAQFLTTFQHVYRCEADPDPFFVTPDMLQEALRFEELMIEKDRLEKDIILFERNNMITSDAAKAAHCRRTSLSNVTRKLDKLSEHSKQHQDVLLLLERTQVWNAKALVQEMFVEYVPGENGKKACQSSLLNIPSATYANYANPLENVPPPEKSNQSKFSKIFQKLYYKNLPTSHDSPMCSLAINPNIHTWQEFTKYAWVVSLLPDHLKRKLATSTLAKTAPKDLRESTHPKFEFNAADLVALWIRSLRNTSARRHLLQLFHVTQDGDNYRATFVGNHPHMTKRVWSESVELDKLVAVLVTNQLLSQNQRIRKGLSNCHLPPLVKRLRQESIVVNKRRKINEDEQLKTEDEMLLVRHCKCFFLGVWARRYASSISELFSRDHSDSSGVWSLCKIEEFALGGKLDQEDSFDLRVLSCVEYLKRIAEKGDADDRLKTRISSLELAANDWRFISKMFLARRLRNGVLSTARSFFDQEEDRSKLTTKYLVELTAKSSVPWDRDTCPSCSASMSGSKLRTCDCCAKRYHQSCAGKNEKTWSARTFLESFGPLKDIYSISIPSAIPDYREKRASEIEWKTKVIKITRDLENGAYRRFGLKFVNSSSCSRDLDRVLDKAVSPIEALTLSLPVGIEEIGLVVLDILGGGCCENSGMQVGDVIVAIELVDFGSEAQVRDDQKFVKETYTLRSMKEHERTLLFRTAASVMKFIVRRPSRNIVVEGMEFTSELRRLNETKRDALEKNESLWYCSRCCPAAASDDENRASDTISIDAANCRAVVHYIAGLEGIEPLVWEQASGRENENTPCVSLRRIGMMLECIVAERQSAGSCSAHAFYAGSTRLHWVSPGLETRPADLLCTGIRILVDFYQGSSDARYSSACGVLLSNFLRVFSLWTLAPRFTSHTLPRTRGPPECEKISTWGLFQRKQTCRICMVCLVDQPVFPCVLCSSLQKDVQPDIDKKLLSLEKISSLVGSTILLLPGDPLMTTVLDTLTKLRVSYDHYGRVFEMLVAVYIPEEFESYSSDPKNGSFFLIPVANVEQIKYLHSQCQPHSMSSMGDYDWTKTLINIDGVVKLSVAEVEARTYQTNRIIDSLSAEIFCQAQCICRCDEISPHTEEDLGDEVDATDFPCKGNHYLDASILSPGVLQNVRDMQSSPRVDFALTVQNTLARAGSKLLLELADRVCADDKTGEVAHNIENGPSLEYTGNMTQEVGMDIPNPFANVVDHSRSTRENNVIDITEHATQAIAMEYLQARNTFPSIPACIGKNARGSYTVFSCIQLRLILERMDKRIRRHPLQTGDLFKQAAPLILTRAEAALLLYGATQNMLMLAVRIICPRYNVKTVLEQLRQLSMINDPIWIPRLSHEMWTRMISLDAARYSREIELFKQKGQYPFLSLVDPENKYHIPVVGLSVDTAIGETIRPQVVARAATIRRIRGGGPELVKTISQMPLQTWNGTLVEGMCNTTHEDDDKGEAKFTGHVVLPSIVSEADCKLVQVDIFHVDNLGLLQEPLRREFDPDDVNVPDLDSGASRLEKQYLLIRRKVASRTHKTIPRGNDEPPEEAPIPHEQVGEPPEQVPISREQIGEPATEQAPIRQRIDTMKERIRNQLLRDLVKYQRVCLGWIQSGITLYVFISDPTSLYAARTESTVPNAAPSKDTVKTGIGVCSLFAALCAELHANMSQKDHSKFGVGQYETAAGNLLLIAEKDVDLFLLEHGLVSNASDCTTLHLVAQLASLFDVYETGRCLVDYSALGISQYMKVIEPATEFSGRIFPHIKFPCSVCSFDCERTMQILSENGQLEYTGSGCFCIGNMQGSVSAFTSPHSIALMDTAKNMLLDLASKMPCALKSSGDLTKFLWQGEHENSWSQLVKDARHLPVLCQAFAILRWSLDAKRMPRWWGIDVTGWSTASTVLACSSASALLLHLYILDFAVDEACFYASQEPLSFQGIAEKATKSSGHEERIGKTVQKCAIANVKQYNGADNHVCAVCQDGGELVICEYCPNVLHLECCGLKQTPDNFVCLECAADAEALA